MCASERQKGFHGSPFGHRTQRPHQRAGAAHPRIHAGHRALVPFGVDGAHPPVLFGGGHPQRRLQTRPGGHQPVPLRLEPPHARDDALGRASRHGRHRENMSRSAQPAVGAREHPGQFLFEQLGAAAAHLSPSRFARAFGLAVQPDQRAHHHRFARWRVHHAGALGAHPAPFDAQAFRPLHDFAQQRSERRCAGHLGRPARAVPLAAFARRMGHSPQAPAFQGL